MTDTVYTIDEIRAMILPLLEPYHMTEAYLFGSYARGDADPTSDIDVLLYRGPFFRPIDVFGVAEELYEASGKKVDVYEISELNPGPFRNQVLSEAVQL